MIVNTQESTNKIYFDTVKKMVGLDPSVNYSAPNIKIGIIDEGKSALPYLYNNTNLKYAENWSSTILEDTTNNSYHTSKVLSTMFQIVTDSNYYVARFETAKQASSGMSTLKDNVEWLLKKNVNIINMSFNDSTDCGVYNGYCAYLDYIVANNNVLFVKSAGNDKQYVTSPGGGMNVLTVGSVCPSYNVSSFSSYGMQSAYNSKIMKPNLVAPGEFRVPLPYSSTNVANNYTVGTSIAAPIVTAIAALLMQNFEDLKTNINKLITLLMAGAQRLPSQSSVVEQECGVGIVNYAVTVDIINNGRVYSTLNDQNLKGDTIDEVSFNYNGNTEKLTMMTMCSYPFEISLGNSSSSATINKTRYSLDLYDSYYNYVTNYTSGSNFIINELELSSYEVYTLEIKMNSTLVSNNPDRITIVIS